MMSLGDIGLGCHLEIYLIQPTENESPHDNCANHSSQKNKASNAGFITLK